MKKMGWRIVEINTDDHLKLYLNNLLIKRNHQKLYINISDIDVLIIDNYKLNLSTQLINYLTKNNALIILMDTRHTPSSYVLPVSGHHNSLKIFRSQLEWTNIFKGNSWKEIIKNKINNQMNALRVLNIDYSDDFFYNLMHGVKRFDITNREGHAAKVYWHKLFGSSFIRDYDARKNKVLNSALNYGYAVLRGMVIKSIIKKGLDSRISFFHKNGSNFFALASDIMEPFRPIIDIVVYSFKDKLVFDIEMKEELIKSLTEKVYIEEKAFYINNGIDYCIDKLIAGKPWPWVDIWK